MMSSVEAGTLVGHALNYAAGGLEVFPLDPRTKAPFSRAASQLRATTDAATIERWWSEHPDALIGCRIPPGVVLLDIDPRHNGMATWRALSDGRRCPTRVHYSGRNDGGAHLWFGFELGEGQRFSSRGLDEWARAHGTGHAIEGTDRWVSGIDLLHRAHRYTILPPSTHPDSGLPYRWRGTAETEILALPPWVAELVITELTGSSVPAGGPAAGRHRDDESIIGWFNRTHDIGDLLARHGWTAVNGDGTAWRHPNATTEKSATITSGELYVYSPNTPFEVTSPGDPHGYDAFDAWRTLERLGSRSEASRVALGLRDGPRISLAELVGAPAGVDPETGEVITSSGNGVVTSRGDEVMTSSRRYATTLPPEFWAERAVLDHVRRAAHARNRSADAVLHAVLARVAAFSPFQWEIPPIVGAPGSLNLFTAVIGPSGAGKSTAVAIAQELVPASSDAADGLPLGSGEGLAEAYMGQRSDVDDKGRKIKVRCQIRYNAFCYVDEGEALIEHLDRKGTTIMETLRRAWSGATLGQANASAERNRVIASGMYRMGLCIGFQPDKAGRLLSDHTGGTPQRFLWCSAVDPAIPDDAAEHPGPLVLPTIPRRELDDAMVVDARGLRRFRLDIDPDIREQVWLEDRARARGDMVVDALDSHATLHRLKLASLLAVLEGRFAVNLDDWRLSAVLWDVSCAVRHQVALLAALDAQRAEEGRLDYAGRRATVEEAARAEAPAKVERHAKRLADWLHDHGGEVRPSELRNRMRSTERSLFESAITYAVAHRWMVETEQGFEPGESRPA